MPFELVVYILNHRYLALNKALYGEEHGFGERIRLLEMVSGQRGFEIKLPVLCRCVKDLPFLETGRIEKLALCDINPR
jgi:hypothetical protein